MIFSPSEEDYYPEFPDLIYSRNEAGKLYFDATRYLENHNTSGSLSTGDFRERFAFEIEALCEGFQIAGEEFSVVNPQTSHVMVVECGEFLFLSYVNRWLGPYLYLRIRELFTQGFTVSDDLLKSMHGDRFGESTSDLHQ